MSYKAVRAKDALRICTEILLAREEFAGEYTFLRRLKTDDAASKKIDTFFSRTLDVKHYNLKDDTWKGTQKSVDVLDILTRRNLNNEENDHTTKVVLGLSQKLRQAEPRPARILWFVRTSELKGVRGTRERSACKQRSCPG